MSWGFIVLFLLGANFLLVGFYLISKFALFSFKELQVFQHSKNCHFAIFTLFIKEFIKFPQIRNSKKEL